ncbi:MAG: hypothetical protein FJZ43_02420 [Candidatus Staskawiczbacteria bacterium]|nr:hypothetical protein [Candidatus Staskawiczbacteria bacterium]
MCWLDKKSLETMKKLRDEYNISTFLETGTFKGINAKVHSYNFKEVLTCDIKEEYLTDARKRLEPYKNVHVFAKSSPTFITDFIEQYKKDGRTDIVFMFLDAHFYDPNLPPEEKWVVINELKVLKGFKNAVLCLHDFDAQGLGHCTYDGVDLGWPLVKEDIIKVNPDFNFYTNKKEFCEIYDENTIKELPGIDLDEDTLSNIKYTHSTERLTYRGFLYATPTPLDLNKYSLIALDRNAEKA